MLATGVMVGPYKVLGLLGAGGMGEVYRARDPRLARDVALKLLPADRAADPERMRRFSSEAMAAGALNHPNLLAVFDTGRHDGAPYIVFELLEGQTLRDRLDGAPIPLRKAIEHSIQIALALAAAHERNIVHRDLKPENLFLTSDGYVKVLDFGLAKLSPALDPGEGTTVSAISKAGAVLGTVGYMSPEQVEGRPVDRRSDIFSFGVVLYEMLSGRRAFQAKSAAETMTAILREDPPDLAAGGRPIPVALERITRHCLEKQREDRFQSARDVAFALEALSGTTFAPTPMATRRRWLPALLGGLGLALLLSAYLAGRAGREPLVPNLRRLTHRRGDVSNARFTKDGRTIVYGAAWGRGPIRLFSMRVESPESSPLERPDADILAVSSDGELALSLERSPTDRFGTLATAPLAGGGVRERLTDVRFADWSADGGDLAVLRRNHGRLRLEFPIGHVLYEVPEGAHVSDLRVSRDGRQVALAMGLDRMDLGTPLGLVLVDRSGRATPIEGSSGAVSFVWSPRGEELWYAKAPTGGGTGILHAVDPRGRHRVLAQFPAHVKITDLSRDGRALMVMGQSRFGLAFVGAGDTRARDLSWFGASFPAGLSADGATMLFNELDVGTTFLRSTRGSAPAVKVRAASYAQALSPDGALAVLEEDPGRLLLVPTGAGESRPLTPTGLQCAEPVIFLPDGKRILATCHPEGSSTPGAYLLDLGGGEPRPLPEAIRCHAVSPDGREAVCSGALEQWSLFPIDGGRVRPIPGLRSDLLPLAWSADGRSLFVYGPESPTPRIDRFDLATGRLQVFKEIHSEIPDSLGMLAAVLTPDGRSLAYSYSRSASDLWLVDGLAR